MKTQLSEITFTDFIEDGQHHFAADWHDTSIKYTRDLNKQVRKQLKAACNVKYGYFSGITGSSVYATLPE